MKTKKLPEKIDMRTISESRLAEKINELIDFLSEDVEGEGGCCEKCDMYLDYKDSHQCSNGDCKCHKPTPQKPSWEGEFRNKFVCEKCKPPRIIHGAEHDEFVPDVISFISKTREEAKAEGAEEIKNEIRNIESDMNGKIFKVQAITAIEVIK